MTGVSVAPGAIDTADPIVGKPVQLVGRLVDLNPLTDHGTQLFFDSLRIGDAQTGVDGASDRRMHARFLNFDRNIGYTFIAGVADATWDATFPAAALQRRNGGGSPALKALFELIEGGGAAGIAVRFRTYRTLYYQNGIRNAYPQTARDRAQLKAYYRRGENFSNPVYSVVCGVITPWTPDEPERHPAGRILIPQVQLDPAGGIGVTFAEFGTDPDRLTLDFGNTIPRARPESGQGRSRRP